MCHFKKFTHLSDKKSYFCEICSGKQSVRGFNENQQYKIRIKKLKERSKLYLRTDKKQRALACMSVRSTGDMYAEARVRRDFSTIIFMKTNIYNF